MTLGRAVTFAFGRLQRRASLLACLASILLAGAAAKGSAPPLEVQCAVPPRITSAPPVKAVVGTPYTYPVVAVDADGDSITFALPTAPSGMSIDPRTGLVAWTPLASQLGLHAVVVEAHSDSGGLDRQPYQLSVVPAGHPPIAVAGPDQMVLRGYRVLLDGSRSRDPEGTLRSFSWTLVSRPAGSLATLTGATAVHPWFMADVAGEYRVQLVVGDGALESAPDEVVIRTQNVTPVAVAGADQVVAVGATVQLDGSGSSDADSDVLRFQWSFVTVPVGSNAAFSDPSAPAPTFVADRGGSYVVRLVVNDGRVDSPADQVVIRANSPPIASAGFDRTLSFGGLVSLDGSGSHDPEQDPITYQWSLVEIPAGSTAQLSAPASRNPTFTADRVGAYVAVLVVHDGLAASAPDSVRAVATNAAPHITSLARTRALRGERYIYDVDATDADPQDALTYSLQTYPTGMTIVPATGVIEWTPPAVGSFDVVARVTDLGGLTGDQPFTITVSPDTVPPTLRLTVSPPIVSPGQPVTLTVAGEDNAGGVTFSLTVDGNVVPLDTNHQAVFTSPTVGVHPAVATATDESGNSATATDAVRVSDGSDTTGPVARLLGPDDLAEVTFLTDIIGTVSDDNFYRYELSATPADRDDYFVIGGGFAPVDSAALGIFDPTLLENGLYKVRLVAEDVNGLFAEDERVYQVEGGAKVGVFRIAFVDLQVPVAGIPITVIRSYDSRNKTRGDFGVGWRSEVRRGSVVSNRPPGMGWAIEDGPPPLRVPCQVLSELKSHLTEVRLSDRERYKFVLRVEDVHPATGFGCIATARFEFLDGTTQGATLAVVNDFGSVHSSSDVGYQGDGYLVNYDPSSGQMGQLFNPTRFLLTTLDGRQVEFNGQLGGVVKITDNNDNALSFSASGVTHSSGPAITFVRDALGRITQITDPIGNVLLYEYDARADLVDAIDALGNRTRYIYDHRHNLLEILDPLGNRAARCEYDSDGRLIAVVDPQGNTIQLTHNLGEHEERTTDRLGHASLISYDERGNVIRRIDPLGNVTTATYDARDNVLTETDALGNVTTYGYDSQGRPIHLTNPVGDTATLTYDGNGRVLTMGDGRGNVATNTYDARGNLLAQRDPLGHVTSYTYSAKGLKTSITDPLGHTMTFEYDDVGNVTKDTDALGNVRMYTYDNTGNQLSQSQMRTTLSGIQTLVTRYEYDAHNRRISTTRPDGTMLQTIYNTRGQQIAAIGPAGRRTDFIHDLSGRIVQSAFADGSVKTSTYDAEGRLLSSTDPAGRTTRFAYDAVGRMLATTFADGSATSMAYDAAGRLVATTDPRGNTTRFIYDGAGRRTQVRDALGNVTSSSYDGNGNLLTRTDARGNTTQFTYDAADRLIRATFPDGATETTTYDAAGHPTRKTDPAGRTTRFDYDGRGRLIQVVDALNQMTSYSYDELGSIVTQTDANGHMTRFEYDLLGRRTKRTLPLGMYDAWEYDGAGYLIGHTDANGRTTTSSYDAVGRLLRRAPDSVHGQPPIVFTYTAAGQRASMTDATGTTSYTYDAMDRLVSKTTPLGTLMYTYDAAGNVHTLRSSNANGSSVDYAYDALNRLASATDHRPGGGMTAYSYDPAGSLSRVAYPNGVGADYTFDSLNRLTAVAIGNGVSLASYEYTLGAAGNRLSVQERAGRTVSYTYDALYRLTQETVSGDPFAAGNGLTGYTYDPVGNRLARMSTIAGVPGANYAYDANDRLAGDTYDANGNQLTSGNDTYAYDFDNLLTGLNGGAVTFAYDGDGNRVASTHDGVTTGYLVDDLNPTGYPQVVEEIVGGAVQRVYTYGLDLICQDQLVGGVPARSYYGYDGHGNVRLLTDTAGAVSDRYEYDAYGNLIQATGTTPNRYLHSGEQFEANAGLYYLRARYYDQSSGRFLTADTFEGRIDDPLSLHRYLYVHNDPVNYVDPSGHESLMSLMTAAAIVGVGMTFVHGSVSLMGDGSFTPDAAIYGITFGWSGSRAATAAALSALLFLELPGLTELSGNGLAFTAVGAAVTLATQLHASSAGSVALEHVATASPLEGGWFLSVSSGLAPASLPGTPSLSVGVYGGSAWGVPYLRSYKSFPAPAYGVSIAAGGVLVGSWFNPNNDPYQHGYVAGLSVRGDLNGASATYSTGPYFEDNYSQVRAWLGFAWPPLSGTLLLLKARE